MLIKNKKGKSMFELKKKKWKCSICGVKGKFWQSSWKANRSGRQHINREHKRKGVLIIIEKKIRKSV